MDAFPELMEQKLIIRNFLWNLKLVMVKIFFTIIQILKKKS